MFELLTFTFFFLTIPILTTLPLTMGALQNFVVPPKSVFKGDVTIRAFKGHGVPPGTWYQCLFAHIQT